MPGPLRYRFRVSCPVERAFQLWTASAAVWWPMATHAVSGRRDSVLVIEPGAGGRIYEQTADGWQLSWGQWWRGSQRDPPAGAPAGGREVLFHRAVTRPRVDPPGRARRISPA